MLRHLAALCLLGAPVPAAAADAPRPEPVNIRRTAGAIAVDGDLDDPGWQGASVMDRFYETSPGDNAEPKVKTVAWVAYDQRYLYIAVKCFDPEPSRIRAPYVERDAVIGTDDNVAIFLDTRNDRRSAVELRVNPRGVQADAVFSDANFNEDFSPDFFFDSAARITGEGWQAEVRVPFATLRYPEKDTQEWGIRIWRNYPREFRYGFYSSPSPRGANCYVCHLAPLTGLVGLPTAGSMLVVPYAFAQDVKEGDAPGERDAEVGLDLKWTPSADTALDLTLNPDFSQVEGDVAQIAVNQRFALFFPEKRPFFLEGVDLFDTPIQAVYTRTVTAPRGGARLTGKVGRSTYTALLAHDAGGGLVVLPGPEFSDFAPQDFRSWVGLSRIRTNLGSSFVGLVATGRAIEGGGHNVVAGPDFQWRRGNERITGQLLLSRSRTPERPELAAEWDGRLLQGHALEVEWNHDTRGLALEGEYRDFGDGFRNDQGLVSQVGYRAGEAFAGYNFWPEGFLRQVRPFFAAEYAVDRGGDLLQRQLGPGVFLVGPRNLAVEMILNLERALTGGRTLPRRYLSYFVQLDPSRRLTRVVLQGTVGEDIDVENARTGSGASITASATVRPDPRLTLDLVSSVRWLDVDPEAPLAAGRLFTAQVQRLKGTFHLDSRALVRLIGQYVTTRRDPALFAAAVPRRDAEFSGSALFSYRLNWQTALYVGYGDERALDEEESLRRTQRSFFFKVSYAVQRTARS